MAVVLFFVIQSSNYDGEVYCLDNLTSLIPRAAGT